MTEKPILLNGDMVRAVLAGRKTQTRRPATKFRVRLRHEVRSDVPVDGERIVAPIGDYDATLNQHGAVSIVVGDQLLGLRPGEFDFLCPWATGHTYLRKHDDGRQVWTIQAHDSAVWVRETWCPGRGLARVASRDVLMAPSGAALAPGVIYQADDVSLPPGTQWRPSIHMPRWACRLVLEITEVRVERLQDINNDDAQAEGIAPLPLQEGEPGCWWAGSFDAGPNLHGRTPRDAFRRLWISIYGAESWAANPWVWAISFERADVTL